MRSSVGIGGRRLAAGMITLALGGALLVGVPGAAGAQTLSVTQPGAHVSAADDPPLYQSEGHATVSPIYVGDSLGVAGTGFASGEKVTVGWDAGPETTVVADDAGNISAKLPARDVAGTFGVTAVGAVSRTPATFRVTVLKVAPTVTVALGSTTVTVGDSVRVTIRVTVPAGSVAGVVVLRDGLEEIGRATTSGAGVAAMVVHNDPCTGLPTGKRMRFTCPTYPGLPTGKRRHTHKVSAAFLGNGSVAAGHSAVATVDATRATSKVTVKASKKKVKRAGTLRLTVRVKAPSGLSAKGKVSVCDRGHKITTVTVPKSGKKTVKVRLSHQAGKHKITVRFAGNANLTRSRDSVKVVARR